MQASPQPDPDVVTTAMPEGDMVLFHLRTREYFRLNETGTFLWNLMENSATLAGMSQALCGAFDITGGKAAQTVRELMRDLKTHHLITMPEPRTPNL